MNDDFRDRAAFVFALALVVLFALFVISGGRESRDSPEPEPAPQVVEPTPIVPPNWEPFRRDPCEGGKCRIEVPE